MSYKEPREVSPGIIVMGAVPPVGPPSPGVLLLDNTALQIGGAVASATANNLFTVYNPDGTSGFVVPSGGGIAMGGNASFNNIAVASAGTFRNSVNIASTVIAASGGVQAMTIGSVTNFGIFFGSNATPGAINAAVGSFYLSTAAASGARIWSCDTASTNGTSTWLPAFR